MRRRFLRRSSLFAVCVLTAAAAAARAALPIDVENLSMKSQGTAEARAAARRQEAFGVTPTVVLLPETGRAGASGEADTEARALELERWTDAVRSLPEVRTAQRLRGRSGADLLVVEVRGDSDGRYADAVRHVIDRSAALLPAGSTLSASGQPVGEIAIAESLAQEERRIVPVILLVLTAVLSSIYRRPALALGAVLAPIAGILWTGGLQAAAGLAVDPVSTLLAPCLLTVGVASSVHLIERHRDLRSLGADAATAARLASRQLLLPVTLSAVTSVAGFLGLAANPIPAVQRFGALAAAGVLLTTGGVLWLLPAWLARFDRAPAAPLSQGPRVELPGFGVLRRHASLVVVFAGAAGLAATLSWTRLTVDTDPVRVLPPEHPFRIATSRIGAELGGTDTFDVLLDPPHPSPLPLKVASLSQRISAMDGVARLAGLPRRCDSGEMLVTALLAPSGSKEREHVFAEAEDAARELGWAGACASGAAVQVARDSERLVRGQLRGLGWTALALFATMAIGFRSPGLALVGLVPNALPCILLYGGLAWFGRPLSVGSAMVGSALLGLVVDDTIHLLHAWRIARASGFAIRRSVARALAAVGRPMGITSLVLACGFASGFAGRLETTREFAVLAAATVLIAMVANLVLLPALLLVRDREPKSVRRLAA